MTLEAWKIAVRRDLCQALGQRAYRDFQAGDPVVIVFGEEHREVDDLPQDGCNGPITFVILENLYYGPLGEFDADTRERDHLCASMSWALFRSLRSTTIVIIDRLADRTHVFTR